MERGKQALARISSAADAIDAGALESVPAMLDGLDDESWRHGCPEERLARLFAMGLRARTGGGRGGGNLYRGVPDEGVDMIGAFDVLVSATPFIRFAYASANAAIAAVPADDLHIVDIGIGQGSQWEPLFRKMGQLADAPRLRLTGIDLPAPGERPDVRVRSIGDRLAAAAARHGLTFSYRGIAAAMEDVRADDLDLDSREALAVNMALALHHTATDGGADGVSPRDEVLSRILAMAPAVLTLVEPDSEHDVLPFRERVDEALAHYGAIFRALEQLVPSEHPARPVLEDQFFGREIVNVVGFEGRQRVERHQRHRAWADRLRASGFTCIDAARWQADVTTECGVEPPGEVTIDDGTLVLQWEGTALLSSSAWTVGPARSLVS